MEFCITFFSKSTNLLYYITSLNPSGRKGIEKMRKVELKNELFKCIFSHFSHFQNAFFTFLQMHFPNAIFTCFTFFIFFWKNVKNVEKAFGKCIWKKCEKMHFENAFGKNVKNAFQKCEKMHLKTQLAKLHSDIVLPDFENFSSRFAAVIAKIFLHHGSEGS